jgi:hypothetical protein
VRNDQSLLIELSVLPPVRGSGDGRLGARVPDSTSPRCRGWCVAGGVIDQP